MMKPSTCATVILFGASLLATALSRAQTPDAALLTLEAKIPLGDVKGRIDHMAFDPVRNRLLVAELENNTLGIVDLKERKVAHVIDGLSEPQGVGYDPSTDTLYVANGGDGSVRVYRAADYAEAGRIKLGDDADNIRIDAGTKHVLVGYGAGAIATIDPATRTKIADFALPVHPEGFQLDTRSGEIFVNLPRNRTIVALDAVTGRQKAVWSVKERGANFPMALDETARRIVVAHRAPPRLAVLSSGGESIATVELCGDSDDVFVDAKRGRLYVSCGEGYLDVFDARSYARLGRLPTSPGARTSYYVASIDRLFVAVRATSAEAAAIWIFRPTP
jgi:DNA-binding beta-propeller fold protein YncE